LPLLLFTPQLPNEVIGSTKRFFFQAKVLKPIATFSSKADLLISVKYGYNFLVVLAKKESRHFKERDTCQPKLEII
jgi:hypothetical protein